MAFSPNEPINLVWRFRVLDPVTQAPTLQDPTTVTFTVSDPDGVETVYITGDPEVTNPSVGVWVCLLSPPHAVGGYLYRVEGAGNVEADSGWQEFTVSEPAIVPSDVPTDGPCEQWINGDDIVAAYPALGLTEADALNIEMAARIGSDTMYQLSGRRYPGVCEKTVRPCRDNCSCFAFSPAAGLGVAWGWGGLLGLPGGGGWWLNDCGDRCGCGILPTVCLAGYPVLSIWTVKIDGQVVDPANYQLRDHRDLVAVGGYTWPACQDLSAPASSAGTFEVTYIHGQSPPLLGKQAAMALAVEVFKALNGRRDCALPAGITRIVRQGITVEKVSTFAALFSSGSSGIPLVDMFIASANPTGAQRPPAVYSPDLTPYPREVSY